MEMRWNLDALYSSIDSEKLKRDFEATVQEIENIKKWAEIELDSLENAVKKIEDYLQMQISFLNQYSRLYHFAELTLSVEAKNEKALKTLEQLEELGTELKEPNVKFQKWLSQIPNLEKLISTSPTLEEHRFYLQELVEKSRYLLSDKEEVVLAKMKNTGSSAWSKLQELLTSTLLVDITIDGEDKQLPLPVVRNMAYDANPTVRKTAYETELKAYRKIEESSAASLNGIKGEVITESKMRGYTSPLEKTLIDSRMDQKILDAMLTAIRESLPSFHRFYRKKAEILGHQNGLPFYDLFAPIGKVDKKYTYEEARDFIVTHFRQFSDRLADFAEHAFTHQWIDAEPREGKRGGAFCSNLHEIKESRILSNFTGSFSDVTTLAHELGHAYHGACLAEESILNSDYPMPLAETASIFCETIVKNAALQQAEEEEALFILENDISDAGQVIVDIYSRFLFESEVFKRREEGSLSVDELKEVMLNAQKEAYGNGLDHQYLHPYMWVCKPHYYFADYNFYNFPYAFGLLFAKGLYAEYLKRGKEFVKEYDQLLSVTGKMKIADVTKTMGIDVTQVDFWRNSLKLIEQDIETFVNLT
ncbi:M3 family oligoendopeptidase [Tepidibacillus fermentans]|uniref:PepF/M3 family oligoendopeptidase n=1 Tax=Tepidibacillus fermentans TaxID=1281767 RepID=A0A4R3KIP1_9BACI|nr:M3 family oligoendopeptidase [Tepidibacillus fermentans]TCS83477.1 pepF/M3 family oligoendopeptidase [Tepidibacillus fermentans]